MHLKKTECNFQTTRSYVSGNGAVLLEYSFNNTVIVCVGYRTVVDICETLIIFYS